jgi:microcystin degradation protein MlrC
VETVEEQVRERLAGTHHEVAGMFHGLDEAGEEAVPIFAARAMPFGVIRTAAIERLLEMMFAELERAGGLDGILVAPHGATVSEPYPDVDGHWLGELRRRVGPSVPIIGTLDAHANLSPAMVAAADALIAYRTNPHLDQRARGIDAARMMIEAVRLLLTGDEDTWSITALTLRVSLTATAVALLLGVPFGTALALGRFAGRACYLYFPSIALRQRHAGKACLHTFVE